MTGPAQPARCVQALTNAAHFLGVTFVSRVRPPCSTRLAGTPNARSRPSSRQQTVDRLRGELSEGEWELRDVVSRNSAVTPRPVPRISASSTNSRWKTHPARRTHPSAPVQAREPRRIHRFDGVPTLAQAHSVTHLALGAVLQQTAMSQYRISVRLPSHRRRLRTRRSRRRRCVPRRLRDSPGRRAQTDPSQLQLLRAAR